MIVRYKAVVAGCAALLSGVALAHFPISVSPESDDGLFGVGWTPIQVGICSHRPFQLFPGDADVYGIAVGLLNLNQKSAIASLAPLNMVARNYFAQVGLIDVCECNYAFEVGLLNLTGRNFGVSAGVFNVEANFGDRGGDPFPWLPGLQVGVANAGGGLQAGFYNIGGSVQIGAINADGHVQIGLLNAVVNGDGGDYGDCSASLQIGLLNYNPHGIAKWLPIINFSCGERTSDMPPSWLEIVYVVVSMAFIVGLFVLGAWMIKWSFRIRRKWLCWLVRILGVLISGYILVCFIVYFVYCRTVL